MGLPIGPTRQQFLTMSSLSKNARSTSRLSKNISIKIMCPLHNLPIDQVDIVSKALMCPECEQAQHKPNLESDRIKATNLFKEFVKEFKRSNDDLEKTLALFKQGNVMELKRKIRATLPEVEKLIDGKMEELVVKGNQKIQRLIVTELLQWEFLNQEEISSLSDITRMLNYKELFQESRVKIEELKVELKTQIATEIKKLVRQYYTNNFKL